MIKLTDNEYTLNNVMATSAGSGLGKLTRSNKKSQMQNIC